VDHVISHEILTGLRYHLLSECLQPRPNADHDLTGSGAVAFGNMLIGLGTWLPRRQPGRRLATAHPFCPPVSGRPTITPLNCPVGRDG
jgi:hypothetical protein